MIIVPDTKTLSVTSRYCPVTPRYMAYESAYSLLCRFALYNVIHGNILVKIFAPAKNARSGKRSRFPSLADSASVSPVALKECFTLAAVQQDALFLVPDAVPSIDHIATNLRVCPVCMVRGVHYTLFQYSLIKQCPIHQIELSQACRTCGGAMDYSLNSKLFHEPYSCVHCGHLLRLKQGQSGRSYLNRLGLERLILAHRIFERSKDRQLFFDVNQPTNIYFDNTAQFSSAITDFAVHQREQFSEVQSMAASGRGDKTAGFYRVSNINRCSPVNEKVVVLTADEFVPILKCIFRHMRKRYLPGIKLSQHKLAVMWRSVEQSEVPTHGYQLVGYLDWLCFWCGVQTPSDLYSKASSCTIRKLRTWLESKRTHDVFASLKGGREKKWLMSKILAHEILFFMSSQLHRLSEVEPTCSKTDASRVVYRRWLGPTAWALIVLPQQAACEFHFSARSAFAELRWWKVSKPVQRETFLLLSH
ncbi:TniQ family protein [Pseudomonas mosselii]|uniref:TniQ family protein n=1 Tax=Pseudomonas mosselii TaxID=78327 RepID=UPI002446A6F2|nr:TniQ family protein [Pseudomonas mosselii]MDH1143195.1 TniQ family protein [Pseudomonas mosselii]